MKPKQYLNSIGIETGGRGRMPASHVALIKEAVAKGISIEGYSTVSTTAVSGTSDSPDVERVKASATGVADVRQPIHDDRFWGAKCEGKEIGMRTVCNTCSSSLSYCPDKTPTVNVDHEHTGVVSFYSLPPNSPRVNRWW